ncbi:hypothetical protein [Pleomorphomonas koreensis]|uniref:hypothetical protein n=1 Tax=Pleomorphomonas koreensis TaxID=257440 RepID=UPI00041A7E4C|nr:hypothetical protein [Pleomorphomonas koreensis]
MLSLKLSAPVIGLFSAGLLALGLYGMSIESRPFLSTTGTAADRLAAATDDSDVPFLTSKRALSVYDLDCRTLAFGQIADTIPAEDRPRLDQACFERARSLLAVAPGNARLWLTFAQFAARQAGARDLVFHAIARSRALGPWQYAFAIDRIRLIDTLPDAPPDIQAIIDADIETLGASWRGREALAERYVAMPEQRERITAAIEKLPQIQQRQFLSRVRRAFQ